MRIVEEIVRSGFFWLPNEPEKKLAGILKILDGGKVELEIFGYFGAFSENEKFPRILGKIEKEGRVTLESCFYHTKNLSGSFNKSFIYFEKALFSIHYDHEEQLMIKRFRFSAEG